MRWPFLFMFDMNLGLAGCLEIMPSEFKTIALAMIQVAKVLYERHRAPHG